MPYAPKLEEVFEGLVCDNILAIIKRDMKPALDYFYAADALPDLAERTLGNFIRLNFPALALEPHRVTDGAEEIISSEMKLDAYLAVTDTNGPAVTKKLMKYVRAFKSILRNAPQSDYIVGMTAGTVLCRPIEMSWEYGEVDKNPNLANSFMRPVSFELTLRFMER